MSDRIFPEDVEAFDDSYDDDSYESYFDDESSRNRNRRRSSSNQQVARELRNARMRIRALEQRQQASEQRQQVSMIMPLLQGPPKLQSLQFHGPQNSDLPLNTDIPVSARFQTDTLTTLLPVVLAGGLGAPQQSLGSAPGVAGGGFDPTMLVLALVIASQGNRN